MYVLILTMSLAFSILQSQIGTTIGWQSTAEADQELNVFGRIRTLIDFRCRNATSITNIMTTVSTYEARQNFAKLIELAFYKNEHVRVKRNNKPIAWIVGDPFMQRLGQFVDYLIEHEPVLAHTLAISLDNDVREAIEQGNKEVKARQFMPLKDVLFD